MKKMASLFLVVLAMGNLAMAQKYVPKIGVNSVISYEVYATASGQQIPLTLTVVTMNDPLNMKWELPGLGQGNFQVSAKALESGTKMRIEQPGMDEVTKLKDDATIMVISKNTYNNLVKNQAFELNGTKYMVKADTATFKINTKPADVIHAATANGKTEIWILNNPDFPLICRLNGSPQGIDVDLLRIKE